MAPGVTGVWGWVGEQYSRHLERMGSLECGGGGVRGEQYSVFCSANRVRIYK